MKDEGSRRTLKDSRFAIRSRRVACNNITHHLYLEPIAGGGFYCVDLVVRYCCVATAPLHAKRLKARANLRTTAFRPWACRAFSTICKPFAGGSLCLRGLRARSLEAASAPAIWPRHQSTSVTRRQRQPDTNSCEISQCSGASLICDTRPLRALAAVLQIVRPLRLTDVPSLPIMLRI